MTSPTSKAPHHHRRHHPSEKCGSEAFTHHCVEAFKAAKMRVTKPRLAVIDCLAHTDVPLSPREIFENVKAEEFSEEVDQVSVYRIVETLSQLGLVHQIFPSGNYVRCQSSHRENSSHITLHCQTCGKTSELELGVELLKPLYNEARTQKHFTVVNSILQINGTCSNCRAP